MRWKRKAVTNYCRLRGGKGIGRWWYKIGRAEDAECPRCGEEEDTPDHIVFWCRNASVDYYFVCCHKRQLSMKDAVIISLFIFGIPCRQSLNVPSFSISCRQIIDIVNNVFLAPAVYFLKTLEVPSFLFTTLAIVLSYNTTSRLSLLSDIAYYQALLTEPPLHYNS